MILVLMKLNFELTPTNFTSSLTIFASSSEAKHTCYEMKKE